METMPISKNNKGFTLIEVVSALLILVVVAVPLTYIFFQGSWGSEISGKRAVALNFAQQKMEEIIAEGRAVEEEGNFSEAPGYTYRISVTPDGKMHLVTVTVFYEVMGKSQRLSLSTLLPGG
ncbi:MAG: prepilin-type N-terminal cleavage/methylation domain-containing protein [Clostridia bacterium]|nr:prepilin-type N-terminal cleavage/methylation domain-containing protein [Clostridia bacterium]